MGWERGEPCSQPPPPPPIHDLQICLRENEHYINLSSNGFFLHNICYPFLPVVPPHSDLVFCLRLKDGEKNLMGVFV
jgi:hypothetical protein